MFKVDSKDTGNPPMFSHLILIQMSQTKSKSHNTSDSDMIRTKKKGFKKRRITFTMSH